MSSRPLRILYHHRTRARDGQSVHIDELIKAFRAEGHAVDIVGPVRISALAHGRERDLLPKWLYEIVELAYSGVELASLSWAALRTRPDFIYQRANLHMIATGWLAKLLRIPHFVEVNALLAEERSKSPGLAWPKLAAWSENLLWRQASHVLPVSNVLAGYLEKSGVPSDRICVIANGVDLSRFKPRDRARAKQALDLTDQLVLGFVGYVREWHGLEQVIDLLAGDERLAKGYLLVVGDGPAKAALLKRAAKLGISHRVYFTGVVSRDDLAGLAAAFDIALQPDTTRYASPLKLMEYMAMGHAIVAPDCPNIREIVEHESDALLFDPANPAAFGEAVARLAADPALRERLGAAAAATITRNDRTWAGNARRIASLAETALEETRPIRQAAIS